MLGIKIKLDLKKAKDFKTQGKFLQALSCLEILYKEFKNLNTEEHLKICFKIIKLCNCYYRAESKLSTLQKGESCIKKFLSSPRSKITEKHLKEFITLYNNLAGLHRKNKQFSVASEYFSSCTQFNFKISHSTSRSFLEMIAKLYLNLSSFFTELGNYSESLYYSKESLKILQFKNKLKQVGRENEDLKETLSGICLAFLSIALTYAKKGNTEAVKETISKALEISSGLLTESNPIIESINELSENTKNSPFFYFQLDLGQPFSRAKLDSEPKKKTNAVNENKIFCRYYSKNDLKAKLKFIDEGQKVNFISADKFFFNKITKAIDIESDVKHMKPLIHQDNWLLTREENKERRKISDIRLKKKYRNSLPSSPLPLLNEKLKNMNEDFDSHFEEINKKLNKILASSESKFLIKKICERGKNKTNFPTPKLFFKPSGDKPNDLDLEINNRRLKKTLTLFQKTKDELEVFMESIDKEMKQLKTDTLSFTPKSTRSVCSLSISTQKNLKSTEKKYKSFRRSIGSSFIPHPSRLKRLKITSL